MEYRPFGKTGMNVSVLGFGGAEMGFANTDAAIVKQMLTEALDAGLNVIDTAECYGTSEELIGQTVSHRRDDFHLFTKCGHPIGMTGKEDWSRDSILESIQRSLHRMKTDRVDLVLLHSCGKEIVERGEATQALVTARERGYTRFIGYSGDGAAAHAAIESDAFDALETSISIADQEALEGNLPRARKRDMGVIVKRPIANAAWKHAERPVNEYYEEYWVRLQQLEYDFLKRDLRESVGIALRFAVSQPGVHTAIVGTTKPGRWLENAALLEDGALDATTIQSIRARWREVADASWTGQV